MGLFKKSKENPTELEFHCENCGIDFSRDSSVCRKSIYPTFGNNEMIYYFTHCPECGGLLSAVWFEEEEIKRGEYTGRVRRAVSHLVCTKCFRNIVMDDTFDGKWHY